MKEGIESQYDDPDSYRGDYPPDWAYRIVFRKQLDNNTCTNCGTRFPAEDLEVVRRIPAENGGTNKTTNLLTVCSACEEDITQTGRLNLPESAKQEPASSPETDSHRVLALQSEVPITEEVEGETEGNGQSRGVSRLEASHVETQSRSPLAVTTTTEESDEQSVQDDTDERAGWRRLFVASIGGTAMFLTYLCAIAVAIPLPSLAGDVAFYGLPLAGLVAGVRWRLSTAAASVYMILMYAGIWQASSVEPFISVLAWIPVVAPLAGIAYGLLAERTEFSLRNHLPSDPRLVVQRFR
ncbi:HNH endonuclease (plasmid) [Haloarcula taiwanensis]|uniref:HNH endonuclease n=1 Tax=Haloarcula taiwanensis TaxID=1932004 RepID=A0A2H5A3Z4_9EURY|nr:HNH endonuclease [Haloarcula taiwanensis]AUG49466.1 HNH endonuclease [Haloarcula taiwanensis]